MSPAEYAVALMEQRAELIRQTRKAILAGRTEITTTLFANEQEVFTDDPTRGAK